MASTSWGTRKTLGRRYGTDPALIMEAERLEREYGLIPGREARKLQAAQFGMSLAQQDKALAQNQSQYEDTQSGNKMAGITGTLANVATTGAMIRGMTKGKDEPFFGNWGPKPSTPTPTVAGYTETAGGVSSPTGVPFGSPEEAFGMAPVNPAMIDSTTSAAPLATGGGAAAAGTYGAQGGIGTGIGELGVDFGMAGSAGGPALAAYEGSRLLGNQFKEDTFVNRTLKDPLTGIAGEGLRGLGKVTGIKEFNKVADTMNQVEKDFIQKPLDAVTNFVSNIVSNLFSW
jgi:hypothetical protein